MGRQTHAKRSAGCRQRGQCALHVGTCGWSYQEWGRDFYAGVPRRAWLAYYAAQFNAVEIDATFYHALQPETFARWHDSTPAHFRFCLKAHRWITHVRRLQVDDAAIVRERDRAAALAEKLAVVVWQLPPQLQRDDERLRHFLARLRHWPGVRHAIEFRHRSWFSEEVEAALRQTCVAAVQSDATDWPQWRVVTTDLAYWRLHGHRVTYASSYATSTLARLARRVESLRGSSVDVCVFFDNTDAGAAPRDALRLLRACRRRSDRHV